jgi:hypothetical protein
MKKYQMSLESALSLVRSKRPQVAPNEGFISQLENFQKSLQGKTQIVVFVLYVKMKWFRSKVTCVSCLMNFFLSFLLFVVDYL